MTAVTDKKITALIAATVLTGTDIIPIVQDLAGTPITRYVPISTLSSYLASTDVPGTVTLAEMANLAANSIIGNNTGISAAPIALTVTQTRNLLGLGTGSTPTFTGALISGLTASVAVFTDGSNNLVSNTITGTGNVVMSVSPTLSGTATADIIKLNSVKPVTDGTSGIQFLKLSNGALVMNLDTTNRRVGIGAVPGNVHFQVTGISDDTQVLIRGNSSQTNPLFQLQTAAGGGTVVTTADASGNWDLFQTFRVRGHSIMGGNMTAIDPLFVLAMAEHYTTITAGQNPAMIAATATATLAFASGSLSGGSFEGVNGVASPGVVDWIGGSTSSGINSSSGTVNRTFGVQGLAVLNSTTGTTTLAAAVMAQVSITSAGTMTSAAGFYCISAGITGGGAITTLYGIYLESISGATNNYSIYANAGPVSILGDVTRASASGMVGKLVEFRAATLTITGTTQVTTVTGVNYVDIAAPTYTDASAVTVDIGATVSIAGAPTAGGSVTLTTPLALWVQAGNVRLGALTASQAVFTDANKTLVSNAITGTGNVVMSAAPTLTGTATADIIKLNSVKPVTDGTSGIQFLKLSNGAVILNLDSTNRRVGIGTATPGGHLDIVGIADEVQLRVIANATNANPVVDFKTSGNVSLWAMSVTGVVTMTNDLTMGAHNIITDTTTGMKIGTVGGSSGQKLGFYNATPIVQPLLATGAGRTVDDVITTLQNLGLVRQS